MKREGQSESVSECKEERGRKPEGRVATNEKDGKGRRECGKEKAGEDRKWNEEAASLAGKINSGEPANPTRPTLSHSLSLSPILSPSLSFTLSSFIHPLTPSTTPPAPTTVSLSGSN